MAVARRESRHCFHRVARDWRVRGHNPEAGRAGSPDGDRRQHGGNTGNQTVALVIRALALDQIKEGSEWHLLRKEIIVSLVHGALRGTLIGLFATMVYRSPALGAVMSAAVLLNLLIAAIVGVAVPFALVRAGRDPVQGSSVVLTFVTDALGFFLFLGLAEIVLI